MLQLSRRLAEAAGSVLLALSRGKSTSAPGWLADKIDPTLFRTLLAGNSQPPIYITGTNGKSTTAGMLANILRKAGRSIIHNEGGANLISGLLTTLIASNQQTDGQLLFEVDEAVLKKVSTMKPAGYILVTNFFRDQLDRFGELQNTVKTVQSGLNFCPLKAGTLLINADDPHCVSLTAENTLSYGISNLALNEIGELYAGERADCPRCFTELIYTNRWLGHLGMYSCPSCQFIRPTPNIVATNIQLQGNSSTATIRLNPKDTIILDVPLPGLFNVYNALAATAVACELGIAPECISEGIATFQTVFGRSQTVNYAGRNMTVFLIKNPIGASEVLRLVSSNPNAELLIVINDDYADGRDVSWLWDAPFELLRERNAKIKLSGRRGADMAVRLKTAGVGSFEYFADTHAALNSFKNLGTEMVYVLCTYTALLELSRRLKLR